LLSQIPFAGAGHKNTVLETTDTVIRIGLFFIFIGVPLIINPFAFDYWYKPKIDSIYCLLIIVAAGSGIKYFFFKKPLPPSANPLIIPLIIYGAASVLSTVFSVYPSISIYGDVFREEGIFTILSYLALTVIFSAVIASKRQLHALLKGLLITVSLISCYALIQYAGYNPTEHFILQFRGIENRPGSTIGNPNFLGKFLVLTVPLFIVYYGISVNRREKLLLLAGCSISLCALIVTFTRASWFSLIISLAMLFILVRRTIPWRNQKGLLALPVFLLFFIACIELWSPDRKIESQQKAMPTVTKRIESTFDLQQGGVAGRLYLWKKAFVVLKEKPLLGYGLDNQGIAMQPFNLEYARKFKNSGVIDRCHNNYLDIAIAQGVVGLFAYLFIIITFVVWLIKTAQKEQQYTQKILYCGILAAVCGYLVNDIFIFSVVSVSPTFWSLMGITVSKKKN
jgi:putative inorganic carbon (HCO3(-)) transporter